MKEKELTAAVIELAHRHGYLVAHFRTAQTARGAFVTPVQGDGKGFPDLVLTRGHRGIVAELKVGSRKPTPEQWRWLHAFEETGWDSYLWTDKDYPDAINRALL